MKHPLCRTIAQLKAIRSGMKISQQKLSELLGMSDPKQLQNYEQGRNLPSIRRVEEIADALGCEIIVQLKTGEPTGPHADNRNQNDDN